MSLFSLFRRPDFGALLREADRGETQLSLLDS